MRKEEGEIMKHEDSVNENIKFLTKTDLLRIFPFKRTKLQQLLNAGALPVVQVGKTYITSEVMLQRWLEENIGKKIYY